MKNLQIDNYKCLKKVRIDGLKRVNLFTGKNNTGKSTILEALSLFAVKGNILWIRELLRNRGEINKYTDETANVETNIKLLSSFFYNRKISFTENNSIVIHSDSENFELKFVKFFEEDVVEKDKSGEEIVVGKRKIINNDLADDNLSYGLDVRVNSNSQILPLDRHLFRRRPFSFEAYNFHLINAKGDDILNSSLLWDEITLSEKEELVVEALKIIEPNIIRLSFVGEESYKNARYPIVKLKNTSNVYPLKAMGDGINRILNLTLALVNSDNGFLLIDEFENGLHHSVQEKLWEVIFKISQKLNIQVFASTHSNDSINSFATVLESESNYEGSLFRLERKENEVRAHLFSKDEITEAAHQKINLR